MTMEDRAIPLRGMRGMIADKMLRSLQEAAQLTHHAECEAGALIAWKARLAEAGEIVSIEDLLIDRLVAALARHPGMNGIVEGREIRLAGGIHLGIAIALPGDLLVAPAILDAGAMSLAERAAARRDLVARARAGRLTVTEMTGGSFTLSNLGRSRVGFFTPILNAPQIAILGIGGTVDRALAAPGGGIAMRPVMSLSLTFDHRAVDGAPAAAFLTTLCDLIEAAA